MLYKNLRPWAVPDSIETCKITVATAGTEVPIVNINYSTGTITLVDGSANVVGSGTAFVGNVSAFDKLETAGGTIYTVRSVTDDTHLVLLEPTSASEAGVTYNTYTLNKTTRVTITADNGNSGNIYVGAKGLTGSTGFELDAAKSVTLEINNSASNLYLDASANSQVAWIIIEKGGQMQYEIPTAITANQRVRTGGSAGTVQLIATKLDTIAVHISALSTNVASIYVGGSTVSATTGYELTPGSNLSLFVNDKIADLYIYANNTEGCSLIVTRE